MRAFSFLFILLSQFSFNILYSKPIHDTSYQEILFIRRITTCYQEKDYPLVKTQIEAFLNSFPNSSYHEQLYVLLADVYLHDNQIQEALSLYELLKDPSIQKEAFFEKLYCYHKLNEYTALKNEVFPLLKKIDDFTDDQFMTLTFYYAEALLKEFQNTVDMNKQKSLLEEAKDYYETLLYSPYKSKTKLALGMIYSELNQTELAVKTYLELAKMLPEKNDFFLFCAANLQAEYDRNLALSTLESISANQHWGNAASYNWMLLAYSSNQYAKILHQEKELAGLIPKDKQPHLHYILGQSYFISNEYDLAISHLSSFIDSSGGNTQEQKKALFSLMESTFKQNQVDLFCQYFDVFEDRFSTSEDHVKALYLKSKLYQNANQFVASQQILSKIMSLYPNFEEMDTIQYEYALNCYSQKYWGKSHPTLKSFIRNFPKNEHVPTAMRYVLDSTEHIIEKNDLTPELRKQLIEDIQQALTVHCLKEDEKPLFLIKLAQAQYEEKQYTYAIATLKKYLDGYAENPNHYQAYLLTAISFKQLHQDLKFTEYLEKALLMQQNGDISLVLFDAYKYFDACGKEDCNEKAAHYLYQSILLGKDISKTGKLWLANFYYQKVEAFFEENGLNTIQKNTDEFAARAQNMFYNALNLFDEKDIVKFKYEILKLAQLNEWKKDYVEENRILNTLLACKNFDPNTNDPFYTQVLLNIAACQESMGNKDRAVQIYQQILSPKVLSKRDIRNKAKLQLARIRFADINKEEISNDNPSYLNILNTLNDLTLSRYLPDEPIHLEAAIDYANISALSVPKGERDEHLLYSLKAIKSFFISKEDIPSRQYSDMRKDMPNKEHLYQAFMLLIDARISQLEARLCFEAGNIEEAKAKEKLARNLYSKLHKSSRASEYLFKQVENELNQLNEVYTARS